MTTTGPALLRASQITKRFGGFAALEGVNLQLRPGEVRGLLGANGAGKSTLIGVLGGSVRPDQGSLEVSGLSVQLGSLGSARKAGVTVVHQELMLFPDRSVADNIILPDETIMPVALLNSRRRYSSALGVLERLGATIDPNRRVGELGLAERQLVEIARALHRGGRVLVFDEPTSALSSAECDGLFSVIRGIAASGAAVLYVSHHLDEVFDITDTLTVLRDGRVEGEWDTSQTSVREVSAVMVGPVVAAPRRASLSSSVPAVARLTGAADGMDPVDIAVGRGEILGVAGLDGSGASTILNMFAGVEPTSGFLEIAGRRSSPRGPAAAIAMGAVYLPPDRKTAGLWLDKPVHFNIGTAALNRLPGFAPASRGWLQRLSQPRLSQVGVRLSAIDEDVDRLSGGNQQRVMLARCLEANPKLLILNDFTRGVDVAAKAAIHHLIREVAAQGVAVCLGSSDIDELIEMSDRIICLRAGTIVSDRPAQAYDRLGLLTLVSTDLPQSAGEEHVAARPV